MRGGQRPSIKFIKTGKMVEGVFPKGTQLAKTNKSSVAILADWFRGNRVHLLMANTVMMLPSIQIIAISY